MRCLQRSSPPAMRAPCAQLLRRGSSATMPRRSSRLGDDDAAWQALVDGFDVLRRTWIRHGFVAMAEELLTLRGCPRASARKHRPARDGSPICSTRSSSPSRRWKSITSLSMVSSPGSPASVQNRSCLHRTPPRCGWRRTPTRYRSAPSTRVRDSSTASSSVRSSGRSRKDNPKTEARRSRTTWKTTA